MSIVNRRNALVGWLAWNTAKLVITRKLEQAMPGRGGDKDGNRASKAAVIAGLAALGIGAWLAREYLADEGEEGGGDAGE